ncbi:sensor histidine kinase [Promicromonospora sukumoe]|uniref:histidine kinase n=1 Tax=Promicromonospora sukumoe TaxID=88382 RepID=A0A7W3JEL1_9MICO|nr:sensor histidine kinase [Promicromonospora sukumoe]MBA8811412.1 signal transduction histidine kinase [Promicromonospora sukumoe]
MTADGTVDGTTDGTTGGTTGATVAGTAGGPPADDARAVVLNDVWEQQVRWWDAAFGVIVALTAAALVVEGTRGVPLLVALGALAAIVVAYVLWGARAARTRERRLAVAYLVVLVLGTGVAVSQAGIATFLMFIAFAQVWMLLESIRQGVVGCVALTVSVTIGIVAAYGFDAGVVLSVVPQMLVTLLFAVALGLWFHLAMRRAEEHARLLDELRAAQAELARTNHEAGVVAERERLAREIHDTLAQGFTSVVMQAQAATAALDLGHDAAVRERLRLVEDTARDNLAEARALVAAFAPVALQDASLPQALRRLTERFALETEQVVSFEADGVGPLPPATEVVLLRAAQEALTNVRRHARAMTVVVRLAQADGAVTLTVADDGQGFGPDVDDGFGLAGMRDRVRSVGGTLSVESGVGTGTRLRARVPVEDETQGVAG